MVRWTQRQGGNGNLPRLYSFLFPHPSSHVVNCLGTAAKAVGGAEGEYYNNPGEVSKTKQFPDSTYCSARASEQRTKNEQTAQQNKQRNKTKRRA